ncbi:MAG: TetR/AcrR family transcriptional regulator [Candidatus Sericytochromatia bacterium]
MIISKKALVNKSLFLKDPSSTELGERIINSSIKIIDKIGFDNFNFKKLAIDIESTEASIYRYFENKHKLLFYLISWYWSWVKSKLDKSLLGVDNPKEKLRIVINTICSASFDDPETEMIDEEALARIVITEATKSYTTKQVKADYNEGLFEAYSSICATITKIIIEANPYYKNPKTFSNVIIRLIHTQIFFTANLPELIDIKVTGNDFYDLENFIVNIVFKTLELE